MDVERKLELLLNTFRYVSIYHFVNLELSSYYIRYSNRPRVKADVANVISHFKSLIAKVIIISHYLFIMYY